MNGSKNLILGFCAREPFRHLEPFIASLRRTAFAGDVCFIVEEMAAETIDRLRAHGIIVERAGRTSQSRMTAMSSRYFNYLDFLARHAGEYRQVMLTHPASVIFQSDPFAAPLPADIVYTAERHRLGASEPDRKAVVLAYGEAVANNMRDCMAANADITIGTSNGVLRYLVALTHQLSGRAVPITEAIDRGVHNYVVRMQPLRAAWFDPADRFAAVVHSLPEEAIQISDQDLLIGGRAPPALSRWEDNAKIRNHVRTAPRFRVDDSMRGSWPSQVPAQPPDAARPPAPVDAVVAYYQRERDAIWLPLFLGSLRCISDACSVHCVGAFNEQELALLARHNCTAHLVPAIEQEIAENTAHFYLSQTLDQLAADQERPVDQVLVLDSMRGLFLRDPFASKTIGLSLFCEGATRISESDYNRDRLAFFVPPEQSAVPLPIVSSSVLRGPVPVIRDFYRHLFAELFERADLLTIHKVVQGAVNKLCYLAQTGFPITVHPSAAEVYFDFWPSDLAIDTRHGVHVAGTVPAVILAGHPESKLMMKLRIDLSLSET